MADRDTTADVRHFNRRARTYDESWIQPFFEAVHRTMLDLVPDQPTGFRTIVDVGCGTGRLLRKVGARWPDAQLVGVDPAEGMVEVARQMTPGAKFHVATAESLPLPDASVDIVFSSVSFHHWSDQPAGLREIGRVLRRGGYLCIADMMLPAFWAKLAHSRAKSPTTFRGVVTETEFQISSQRSLFGRFVFVILGVTQNQGS